MPGTMSPEMLARLQLHDAKGAVRVLSDFGEDCERYLPLWEARVEQVRETNERAGGNRTAGEIGARIAKNAKDELQKLDNEITLMQTRTGIIVSAATLLFAVFALRQSTKGTSLSATGNALLITALLLTGAAFVLALYPLAPPFFRAWKQSYEKREYWTLLAVDDFTSWVMDCWLCERRTPVITTYKKSHSVAVPLLVVAAILVIPGLGLSIVFG